MSEDANNRSSQGVAWFLAGLGVGALIGILYAPKSGRETREDLAQRARDGQEYLRVRSKQAAEQVGNAVDKGKEQMNQYIGRGREIADRGRAQWQDFVERGKNLVNEKGSRVGAAIDAGREAYRANTTTTTTDPAEPNV
jgi:gas vesicle protein